jgi:hypothetical protein
LRALKVEFFSLIVLWRYKMKKIAVMLSILLFAASSAYAGTVSAGTEVNDTGTGDAIAKLSSSVSLGFLMDVTTYAITTQHDKGTRTYGTAAGDTKIYVQTATGTASPDPDASDSDAFSSWTEL